MDKKRIYGVWTMLLMILTAGSVVAVWRSACAGEAAFRREAEEKLAFRAEMEINREFDALGIPYSMDSSSGGAPSRSKRVLTVEEGTFEVEIDSLKESQSLYPLDMLGFKALLLEEFSPSFLDSLHAGWAETWGDGVSSLLVLSVSQPWADSTRVRRAGDLSAEREDCLIGRYYLDDHYTMQLAAYVRMGFWESISWTSPGVVLSLAGWLLALLAWGGWRLRSRLSGPEPEVSAADEQKLSVWELGRLVYHKDSMLLTCNGQRVDITPQSLKLLCAFLSHGGRLSDEEIYRALGWPLSDSNLTVKKRQAISKLRSCLTKCDGRIQIKSMEKGYKMFLEEEGAQSVDS